MNRRSHKDRAQHKLAMMFKTYNIKVSLMEQESNYQLGLKVEKGTLTSPSEIITAISILDDLCYQGKITKDHLVTIKINLAERLAGFKLVAK